MVRNSLTVAPPEGRIFDALKTEKVASNSIKLDKALIQRGVRKAAKI